MIKLMIVDDHQIVRDGIMQLFNDAEDLKVVYQANNGNEALRHIETEMPDVVMTDISMPEMNGFDLIYKGIQQFPHVKFMVLSMHNEEAYVKSAIKAGAMGYIPKDISKDQMLNAVRTVASGGKFFTKDYTRLKAEVDMDPDGIGFVGKTHLTTREKEILRHIVEGSSSPQIAEKLFISTRTVENHRANIMQKLNVKNAAGLVKFALMHNVLDT